MRFQLGQSKEIRYLWTNKYHLFFKKTHQNSKTQILLQNNVNKVGRSKTSSDNFDQLDYTAPSDLEKPVS